MNNHSVVVLFVISGVCLFAAVRHLSNGFWRPVDRASVLFGMLCCSAAGVAFTLASLYGTWTVSEYVPLMKWNVLFILVFFMLLHWFIVAHTRQRSTGWSVALTALLAGLAVSNLVMPHGAQLTHIERIDSSSLLWGESIATPIGPLAPTFWIAAVVCIGIMLHAIYWLVQGWRQERSVTSMLMLAASGLLLVMMVEGALVRAQLVDFVHLGPFGFFLMVIAMSLTLSFRGRRRLQMSEQRFRKLVEQSPFGVQVMSADGRTMQINRAWHRIWGKSSRADEFLQPLLVKARSGESVELGPTRIDSRWVRTFVYPLIDPEGRVRNLIAVYADVTEQKRAEEEARAATAELQQVTRAVLQQERLRALGQMASGIAHDINNAISPASLYVEALLEKPADLSPRARERLAIVQQAIGAVVQTVMRLREFSRPSDSSAPSDSVDLNRAAEQAIALTRARCESVSSQKNISLRVEFDPAPSLPPINGVESEIRDAVINLILNAIDAMPDGGLVSIKTREANGGAMLEVTDGGVGMDEATRRRCLEPFFTTKGEHGTGLGLAMVYGMIKRHRGDIEIISEPRLGTTFRLRFPNDASPAPAAVPSSAQPVPESPAAGARILLVDDDPMIVDTLRPALEADGHHIMTADDGQSAIDAFELALKRGAPFAAVITDLNMPAVDGQQLSAAVHRLAPGTPVIVITGWAHQLEGSEESMPLVDHILPKPVNLGELRRLLAPLLKVRQ